MTDIIQRLKMEPSEEPFQFEREARITLGKLLLDAATEIERLREKCDKQAMILRRLAPEKFPDTMFISGASDERNHNNMPEKLLVCPAYGVDFSYIYEYTGKTTGPEW
jgi:hypothetical protein